MAPAYSKIVCSAIINIRSNYTTPAVPPNITEGGLTPASGFFDNPVVYHVGAFVIVAGAGWVKRKMLKELFSSAFTLTKTRTKSY